MAPQTLIEILKSGGVAVIPTDTIYGIVGRAENPETVGRIYKIRQRSPEKPCIILISDVSELAKFSINVSDAQRKILEENWQESSREPVTITFDSQEGVPKYLDRSAGFIPFRVPASESLRNLLKQTGPLVAPSANPSGLLPATNMSEARAYFGDSVDFYEDAGSLQGKPSRIIRLHKDGSAELIRE